MKPWQQAEMDRKRDVLAVLRKLPKRCFVEEPATKKIVMVKRGEPGYYTLDTQPPKHFELTVRELNAKDGVTELQERAMMNGSMFGWHLPGADVDHLRKLDRKIKRRQRREGGKR